MTTRTTRTLMILTSDPPEAFTTTLQMERRHLLIDQDGQHVTLGRYSGPTDEELAELTASLTRDGRGAWYVISFGRYYSDEQMVLEQMRELTPCAVPFEQIVARFAERRTATLAAAREGR